MDRGANRLDVFTFQFPDEVVGGEGGTGSSNDAWIYLNTQTTFAATSTLNCDGKAKNLSAKVQNSPTQLQYSGNGTHNCRELTAPQFLFFSSWAHDCRELTAGVIKSLRGDPQHKKGFSSAKTVCNGMNI